jgi:hypothetical protein
MGSAPSARLNFIRNSILKNRDPICAYRWETADAFYRTFSDCYQMAAVQDYGSDGTIFSQRVRHCKAVSSRNLTAPHGIRPTRMETL